MRCVYVTYVTDVTKGKGPHFLLIQDNMYTCV